MDHCSEYEKINKKYSKSQQQLNKYKSYTNNLELSFKRQYNELKLENLQLKYEINQLKNMEVNQTIKQLNKQVTEQMMIISKLQISLKSLCGDGIESEERYNVANVCDIIQSC